MTEINRIKVEDLTHKVSKDYRGNWRAATTIQLMPLSSKRSLDITTSKSCSGDVSTTASVSVVDEDNCKTHAIFDDYHTNMMRHYIKRCTSKAIEDAHVKALDKFDVILQQVEIHYDQDKYNTGETE